MSESPSPADEPKPAESETGGGIFGNLPKERPGARSPRRRATDGKAPKRSAAGKAKATPATSKRSAKRTAPKTKAARVTPPAPSEVPAEEVPRTQSRPPANQPAPRQGSESIGGIEDLAWAGVTVAAHAATAGVKLVSRTLEAVRKSVDRP